jgi:uncharacterized RDD family membrane protein YckC
METIMMEGLYGSRAGLDRAWTGEPPDPVARPDYFDGVVLRRSVGYLIDCVILFLLGLVLTVALSIFGIITFGLGFHLFPLLSIVPIAYSTLLIGGPDSATFGMRLMDVQVRSWSGERPNMIQALVMTLLFYGTIAITWFFGLLVIFFNARRRAAHDFLAGTVVVRRLPASAVTVPLA